MKDEGSERNKEQEGSLYFTIPVYIELSHGQIYRVPVTVCRELRQVKLQVPPLDEFLHICLHS